ncbi:MAG: addiction module protein [Phycisphaerae bacterium]|nr:addiction module protein [Tepidisphaeraceae bacterium]
MKLEAILDEVDSLSKEDQLRLIETVAGRLAASGGGLELSDEAKAEIDRRLAEHEANPDAAIPWEVVEAESLARLRR